MRRVWCSQLGAVGWGICCDCVGRGIRIEVLGVGSGRMRIEEMYDGGHGGIGGGITICCYELLEEYLLRFLC